MAEIQDMSQASEAVNTAPTETVSTGTDGTQVADIAPQPKYRKKVFDVLKNNIYKNNPTNFKLTEQQFYKKIDSDQEYAKKVFGVLKKALPSTQIVQDESQFLSKLYEKPTKALVTPTPKAERPGVSLQVDKKTKNIRVAGAKEFKEVNPEFKAPTLTSQDKTEFRKSGEYKIQKDLQSQSQMATVGDGFRFNAAPTKNEAVVLKGWSNLYNQYNDIADKYGKDDESLVKLPTATNGTPTDKYLSSQNTFKIPGINPATGNTSFVDQTVQSTNKSIVERNAIRAQYNQKIKEVNKFVDNAIIEGINDYNYEDYLTKNRSGDTVPSAELVRNLSKRLISTYTGKDIQLLGQDPSDGALEDIFYNKLTAAISTYGAIKESRDAANTWKEQQQKKFNSELVAKHQELLVKGKAEVDAFNNQLKDKRDAEITAMMAPYLEQGKAINENLEKMTNDFKASVTFDKAAIEVPEIRNAKFNYEIAIKSLSNGQYNQQQANKISKEEYDKYVSIVTPLYNQWQEAKYKNYQAAFEAERQKVVTISAQAEIEAGKIASRYDNQSKAFTKQKNEQVNNSTMAFVANMQKEGVDANMIKGWQKVFNDTYSKITTAKTQAVKNIFYADAWMNMGPLTSIWMQTVNNFGDALASTGYELDSPVLKYLGESFSNTYSVPDQQINSWKEIFTDPIKVGSSIGQVLGRQIPMYASVFIPVFGEEFIGSKIITSIANASISGTIGFGSETVDMAGSMYRRVLNETGDPVKANLASWEIVNDNKKLWWTYGLESLPFIHDFKDIIKGTGFTSMLGKFALRGGLEATTETLFQEFPQSSSEDKGYLKYVKGANNITTYDMMFTNDKIIRDKYNNPLTDSKDGRSFYLTTGGLSRFTSTALNIAPSSFLMGGLGSVKEYASYKYSERVGKNMFAKNVLNNMSDGFHKQQIFQILLNRGKNTAAGYLVALNRSGRLSTEEFTNLSQSLQEMEGYSKMAQRQKWKPQKTMTMAALNFEVSNINTQLQNAELTDQEKDILSKRLDYAKRNLDDFVQGKKADYVVAVIGNQLHILTYAQFDDVMADNDFVENTKGTIGISVAGSGLNSQGEKIMDKATKIFNLRLPNQDELDELERNGPPVMDVFANTEIPHLNNLVYDLEERMNNAEEIDEKDMNSAISGLYEQLQNILDNHYNTENGKRAAQMLMDTIEKFEDYEFTTKEETVDVTERATTQGIREVVNATKNIFGRITGTAKSGAKKFARVVTGFKQQGKYSVEINDKDEVVLTPMSGAPIVLGNRKDLNGKVKFVASSFSNKTGKISTITFRVNEANENGVMPEVTLSTADGFTYDELLDIAIDLRAMEVGEVTTEEFDNAVEEVTSGKKTVKTFPNIGKAEQKEKAKKEAEAQQQAAPEQAAPQATQEQIDQEVQRLQAQQDEEMKAAQDMIKPSNLAKSGMTLNEALKARDEKLKQIKSKYKVLIDNAKKGVTQETQQAEQEQQVQENNEVMDITSANIDELQNIPTDNKFQQRVLNAIPNILKALSKIVPGIKVSVHLTTKSYSNKVSQDSKGRENGRGTSGYYFNKTINIDLSKVKTMDGLVTVFHEAFHGMYKVLPQNMKDMLYKSIQTVIIRDGFKIKVKTATETKLLNKLLDKLKLGNFKYRGSFEEFAKGYKDNQQQEEAVVEFLGHMAAGGVTLTVPGYKMFMEALNKILDKIGMGSFKFTTSNQVKDFAKGVVKAMKTGQDISELAPEIVQGQNGLTGQNISFRKEDAANILASFKEDYNNGNLEKNRNGGSRNLGVYEYEGGIIKLVKRNRKISESQINLMQEKLGDMENVYAPYSSVEVQDGVFAMIMNKAKGIDAAKLNQQEINSIPQEHWDKLENDIRELSNRGVQTDLTKRSNLFYDKKTGFHFIDIEGISIEGESTNKFFEKDGKEYYYAFERYPFFPKEFNGGKSMFENIPSDNNTDISFRNEDIKKLFKSTPELAKIGSQEQYNQYLDTIFPDSKIKDIVYHGVDKNFIKFIKRGGKTTFFGTLKNKQVTANSDKVLSVILNIINPASNKQIGGNVADFLKHRTELSNEYDGLVGFAASTGMWDSGNEFVVFEPEQIHILGNKEDIEGFKKFVEETYQANNISFRNETANLFEQANNLKEKMAEAENTAEKRKFASERREMLSENPSVKLIDDNFKSIIDQLKNNEDFEFKGPCF